MVGWLPGVDADFVWVVPGLAVGGQPSRQQMYRLRRHGVDALLSVRAEDDAEDSPEVAKRVGLRYQRVVVADGIAIPPEALAEVVRLASEWRRAGLGVLIHCQAGRRRGPIAVAAVLVDEGWSVRDALRRVIAARPQTAPTPPQLMSLRCFARGRLHHRLAHALRRARGDLFPSRKAVAVCPVPGVVVPSAHGRGRHVDPSMPDKHDRPAGAGEGPPGPPMAKRLGGGSGR